MKTTPLCPSCGKPLAPDAPDGLCQGCLLKSGFPTGTEAGGKSPRFIPPKTDELAPKFPQLEILEFVGQGGMGAVYKARQKQLGRVVALKILPSSIASGPGFAGRFAREARALASLNHPHIVTLYEFGQADGLFYFLMEFVDGINLRQLLAAGRITPQEALAIVPQICEALQFAHDEGIVHRDIKPENILLDKKGRVKIADFGIAKIVGQDFEAPSKESLPHSGGLTDPGTTLGTPQYMAPEQIKNPLEVDSRADIYSLGVVFYQMLTGELPSGKVEPPSKKVVIDVRLDEVVLRALEKQPALRYQQASALKSLVETIATSQPVSTSPKIPFWRKTLSGIARPPLPKMNRRLSKILFIGVPIAAVLILIVRGFFLQPLVAATDAASPEIPRGSRFLVWKLSHHFLPGDLIAYRYRGHVSAGRVMRDNDNFVLTERNGEALILVPRKAILGKLVVVYWRSSNVAPYRELASAETWLPNLGERPPSDISQIRNEIKTLMDEKSYEEALQRQIWYFNHALEYGESDPVRLSFGMMNWGELAEKYPKARQALVELRDQDTQEFKAAKKYSPGDKGTPEASPGFAEARSRFFLFNELSALNRTLNDDRGNKELINLLVSTDPKLAQHMGYKVRDNGFDTLLKQSTNSLDSGNIGNGQAAFKAIRQQWESQRKWEVHATHALERPSGSASNSTTQAVRPLLPAPSGPPKAADRMFVDQARVLVEILVTNGHQADAVKIEDQALALLDDPWLKSAVRDAQAKTKAKISPPTIPESK
jgi:serine/threonine protein kinase